MMRWAGARLFRDSEHRIRDSNEQMKKEATTKTHSTEATFKATTPQKQTSSDQPTGIANHV